MTKEDTDNVSFVGLLGSQAKMAAIVSLFLSHANHF